MMQTIGATFDSSAARDNAANTTAKQRFMQQVLRLLDRLVPPPRGADDVELPPEFFRYPPV
jgi:hypothetical protein